MWPSYSATVRYLRLPSQKPTEWGFYSRVWHSTWFHFPFPKPGSQFCFKLILGMHNFRENPTGCSSRDSNPGHWPRGGELLTTSPLVGPAFTSRAKRSKVAVLEPKQHGAASEAQHLMSTAMALGVSNGSLSCARSSLSANDCSSKPELWDGLQMWYPGYAAVAYHTSSSSCMAAFPLWLTDRHLSAATSNALQTLQWSTSDICCCQHVQDALASDSRPGPHDRHMSTSKATRSPVQPLNAFPSHACWRATRRRERHHLLRHSHAPPWRTDLIGGGAGVVRPSCPAEDPTLQHRRLCCSSRTIRQHTTCLHPGRVCRSDRESTLTLSHHVTRLGPGSPKLGLDRAQ